MLNISIENMGKQQDKYLRQLNKQQKQPWLIENSLFQILNNLFENVTDEKNSKLKLENKTIKPDVKISNNIIIEFQGHYHFIENNSVYNDYRRQEIIERNGFKYIEIPYFIQLTNEVMKYLFNIDQDFSNGFPHGFIHPDAVTPGSFSIMGIRRYYNFLDNFPEEVRIQCEHSLIKRSELKNIPLEVLQPKNSN